MTTGWSDHGSESDEVADQRSDDSNAIKTIFCLLKSIPSRNVYSAQQAIFPHITIRESTSLNWSGYAAATSLRSPATGSVTAVSGTWIVPTLTPLRGHTYSAFWVGIDGYSSGTVEQLGTEQDYTSLGQSNYAWFEIFPRNSFLIVGFPVNQGDQISASVKYKGKNVFVLSMTNHTQKVTTTIPTSQTTLKGAQRSSAEWIVEAPSTYSSVLPLADFGTGHFSNCTAIINGVTGPINSGNWMNDPLTMETQNGIQKAVPSSLTGGGESFTVTWEHE